MSIKDFQNKLTLLFPSWLLVFRIAGILLNRVQSINISILLDGVAEREAKEETRAYRKMLGSTADERRRNITYTQDGDE